jgi:2-haloalkanoic acid dehalogenase type II
MDNHQKIRVLIFDAYGTILDTKDGSVKATERILKKNNCNLDAVEIYKVWKQLHRQHIAALTEFELEEVVFLKVLEHIYQRYSIQGNAKEDVKMMLNTLGIRSVYPETNEVLKKLHEKYLIIIGSNSDYQPLKADIDNNQIPYDHCFCSETLKIYKPQREFYLKIIEELKLRNEEILFIGDTPADDILAPQSVGMKTFWINRKNKRWENETGSPDYQAHDLYGLLDVF